MKKILYIRTSTPEQNPELQINDLLTICKDDYEIHQEQLSAWADNVKRPVFENIISLIKKRQISDLFVWDLDRIYRNRKRLQEFFILCKNFNCKIHSYRQQWLEEFHKIPSPWNEIMFDLLINIFGWIAEEESTKRSERVRMAMRKKNGKTYSYKGNKWGRRPLPKQTIDRVLALYQQGISIRNIAKQVKTYRDGNGKNISKSVVHKIIAENLHKKVGISECPKIGVFMNI